MPTRRRSYGSSPARTTRIFIACSAPPTTPACSISSARGWAILLRRDAELADRPAPSVRVAPRQLAELLRCRARDLDCERVHARLHVGQKQDAADLAVEPGDQVLRHAG